MQHDISRRRRQNFVSVFLALLALVFVSGLLIFLTAGFLTYFVGIVLAMVALGGFNWLLWGRTLSREVAGEREEEKLRRRALGELPADAESPPAAGPAAPDGAIKIGPSQRFRRL